MPNGTGTVLAPSPMPVNLPPPIPTKIAKDRGRVFVDPPVIHVGSGPDRLRAIRFTNNTGGIVRIWLLDAASLFARPRKDFDNPFVVGAGGTLDLDLKPDLSSDDYYDYPYHVYCDAIGREADGNSGPRIICP